MENRWTTSPVSSHPTDTQTKQSTCVGIWEYRQQIGILQGYVPAAPFLPVPPSPSILPALPRTAPQPPRHQCWTEDGCSCRSPEGLGHRLVHCWREGPDFGPKGQLHPRSHAGEPGEAWSGWGGLWETRSTAEADWKTPTSTGSCCWISEHAAWKMAVLHLVQVKDGGRGEEEK